MATLNHVLMEVDGSDHFPFFSWVMAVGEPGVNLPGCMIFGWVFKFRGFKLLFVLMTNHVHLFKKLGKIFR